MKYAWKASHQLKYLDKWTIERLLETVCFLSFVQKSHLLRQCREGHLLFASVGASRNVQLLNWAIKSDKVSVCTTSIKVAEPNWISVLFYRMIITLPHKYERHE